MPACHVQRPAQSVSVFNIIWLPRTFPHISNLAPSEEDEIGEFIAQEETD